MLMIFSNYRGLHQEGVVGEELVHRMASKREKVADKAALLTLGHQLII